MLLNYTCDFFFFFKAFYVACSCVIASFHVGWRGLYLCHVAFTILIQQQASKGPETQLRGPTKCHSKLSFKVASFL